MSASARTTRFEKWEGLGNDFVIVETGDLAADVVRMLCDRRRGVGADGILLVDAKAKTMRVRNADGSEPEMCGNGLRCVASYLASASGGEITIQTAAGPKRCIVEPTEDGAIVTVGMGVATVINVMTLSRGGADRRFHLVNVGNPHAVTFDMEFDDTFAAEIDRRMMGGTNVGFAKVGEGRAIELVVHERGVGRTLACGTGACAAAAAACSERDTWFGEPIAVRLPGGELTITIARRTFEATMRGPARRVFAGEVRIA